MRIGESFRSSFSALFYNKLRSLLTMLGVIIGVASVIMLTSIGEGVKREVTSQVESLGANLLFVFPGKVDIKADTGKNSKSKLGVKNGMFGQGKSTLTYDDVLLLKGKSDIAAATGVYKGVDKLNKLNILVSTTGVDEDWAVTNKLDLQYGRFISREELIKKKSAAVIGDEVNKEVFDGKNSLGKTFKLNQKDYTVVGILAYKKPQNMGPQSEDINVKIFLPITEMLDRVNDKNISQVIVKASSSQAITAVESTIANTLKSHHSEDEFTVLKQQDMLDTINNILGMLNAALGGIAAISLVVGGIGIMNIMLVSVTERTREIGIRKAVGAKRSDIMSQFLIESVTVSLIGGLLGLGLGTLGSRLLPSAFPMLHTALSIPAVIISILFSFCIGIFFGVYPAARAASLDPVEALRSE